MVMTIGNLSPEAQHQQEGHVVLGYFPTVQENHTLHGDALRRRKRQVMQECLQIALADLKEAGQM